MIYALLEERFGAGGEVVVAVAPGRVNLIGEHTDYNDGFVLPMAIELTTTIAARRRGDGMVAAYAADLDERASFALATPIAKAPLGHFSNYLRGVLAVMQEEGLAVGGVELVIESGVPLGAGLSSSAALEVAFGLCLGELFGHGLSALRLAELCVRAEHEFVGTKCGIMDQLASLLGEVDHALFLDCRTLAYEQIPLAAHRLVICDSGIERSLAASGYNSRRAECEESVRLLRRRFPSITALRDVSREQLAEGAAELSPLLLRRCRHVITENERTRASAQALRAQDLEAFGRLLNASHESQRDDFETSHKDIDRLVELTLALPGVLGARLTGGGFGGCVIGLMTETAAERFPLEVARAYEAETGRKARVWVSGAARGARVL